MSTTIETVMTPLGATGPITSNASPLMGKVNRYNASAGNLAVSLPALSSLLNLGARTAVEKDVLDTSTNTITVNCAGSDTFDNGVANEVLRVAGQLREFEVVQIGSAKYWKIVSGNTPLSQLDARYVAKGIPVVNVKDFGVKGDGSTDDTTAINACIAGSAAGTTIFFPAGTYLISAPIVLLPQRKYVGAGHAHGDTTIIKQKNSANITNSASLTGLLVASAWSTNATTCDNPLRVENLTIDGNKANNASSTACGIVLTNYRSWIVDCDIINTPKDGIRLTDTTANGTNVVTNSCVENRVLNCRINGPGLDGVRNVSANNNSNTDGYLHNCIISGTSGSAINLDRSSGWHIGGNHLYSINVHGIVANNAFGTYVSENIVEDFGGQATAAAYYYGIALTQLAGRQSTLSDNYVGCNETSASVGGYQYVNASSASGSSDSHIIVTGNKLHGPASPTNKGIAAVYATNGGGTSIIYDANNDVDSISSPLFNDGSATVNRPVRRSVVSVTGATTLSNVPGQDVVALVGAGGVPTLPTAVGNVNKYTVKNIDTTSKTLATTSSQTMDGATTLTIATNVSYDVISDGTNWRII